MARNSVCKTAILFVFGGLVYFGLEVLFRGHSHWTMFVLGGFLFLILGELNEGQMSGIPHSFGRASSARPS